MPRFEVNIDSEREFDCRVHDKNSLVLQNLRNMSIRISHRRYTADGVIEDFITLHKNALIRLAAEIQSWCETGEFIKPIKHWVAVYKPNCYPWDVAEIEGVDEHKALEYFWDRHDSKTTKLIGVLPMPEEK